MWRGKTNFLGIKYLIMVICGDFLGVVYLWKNHNGVGNFVMLQFNV
jgi:hypothetical protein